VGVEENKAVIRALEAAINAGRVEAGLDLFADAVTFNGRRAGPDLIRQLRTILTTAVPDARWTLEHLIAEGEWVAVRRTLRGTHTGELVHPALGTVPASGRAIELTYLDHYRIADGRIAEVWEVRDGLALLQQLGAPTP
jgi:predicted ester cyclase